MTPTASASPITLLTTVVEPANSAPAATGKAPALPADGGFQLLIDAAAQQQLEAKLGAAPQKNPSNTPSASAEPVIDGGNVLPLTGLLLPNTTEQLLPSKGDGDKELAVAKDDSSNDTKPAAGDAGIQLLWVPVNIQAAPPAPGGTLGSSNSSNVAASAIDSDGDGKGQSGSALGINVATTTASTAAEQNNAAAKKDDVAMQLAANVDAAAQDGSFTVAKQASAARNTKPTNDPLVAVPSSGTDAKIDPALLNIAAAAKSTEGSSFSEILKPETAAQATAGVSAAALDTGRTLQAARPYADTNTATATVALPVGSNGWSDAVVDKVMWFSANQLSNAEIKLNPPDLGPLQVRISTQHDQASVVFSSPHAAVRDALDQALPRLRDMLGGQGIQLSDASVGGQGASRQQQQQGGDNRTPSSGFFGSEETSDTPIAVTRVIGSRLSNSAVDAYA